MFDSLFFVSIVGTVVQVMEEAFTKPIPAENWANKELYHKDIMSGVSVEQRMKNLENGKYKLNTEQYKHNQKDFVKGVRIKTEFEKRFGL